MSFYKMARPDKADQAFSLYIRKRDNWTCQRCGRKWPEGAGGLTCSHFWGRAKESVRFDPENCDSLCLFPCHAEWEHEKGETKGVINGEPVVIFRAYKMWKINQLGADRFDKLEVRAHTHVKKDRKMELIKAKALLEALEKQF